MSSESQDRLLRVHHQDVCVVLSPARQGSFPGMNQSGLMASGSPYSQPMNNSSGLMNAQAPQYSMTPSVVNSSAGNHSLSFPRPDLLAGAAQAAAWGGDPGTSVSWEFSGSSHSQVGSLVVPDVCT